jgi:hypothetical protein
MKMSGQLHSTVILLPRKGPPVPIGYEAGWTSESVPTLWRKQSLTLARNRIPSFQTVAHPHTDWTIQAPSWCTKSLFIVIYLFQREMSYPYNFWNKGRIFIALTKKINKLNVWYLYRLFHNFLTSIILASITCELPRWGVALALYTSYRACWLKLYSFHDSIRKCFVRISAGILIIMNLFSRGFFLLFHQESIRILYTESSSIK